MPLGLENLPGVGGLLDGINTSAIFTGVTRLLILFAMFLVVAAVFGFIYYKKTQKNRYGVDLHWFQSVNGIFQPVDSDKAAELTIPGTSVKVFYVKKKDLYVPRATRMMGKNSYWFGIRKNKEIVNFTLKDLDKNMKELNLDHDHTDMRYGAENLREMIKRNYRDKSLPWWREYKEIIGVIIFVFVFTVSFFFLIGKIGALLDQVSNVAASFENAARICANPGSGVAPA